MKLGIILNTSDAEVAWNTFRLGVTSLKASHEVNIFLMNKGVEIETIKDEKYNVNGQIDSFIEHGGKILACGTCLESRNKKGSETCPISTMKDLLQLHISRHFRVMHQQALE